MSLPARILRGRKEPRRAVRFLDDPRGRSVPAILDPEAPEPAGETMSVPRYPAAFDSPPTITDNLTPLTGLFHNFLALMLEASMNELGTFPSIPGSLMDFLGVQFANSVSNWRSFQKTFGGNEAGQVYGFIKRRHTLTSAGYSGQQSGSVTNHQGWGTAHRPNGKKPVLFAEVEGFGLTSTEIIDGVGGGVRGEVSGFNPNSGTVPYRFRGCPGDDAPGSPSGGQTQPVNILLAFPVEAP